jgi:hypothetical protein
MDFSIGEAITMTTAAEVPPGGMSGIREGYLRSSAFICGSIALELHLRSSAVPSIFLYP